MKPGVSKEAVPQAADIPPTRQHDAPPKRPSAAAIEGLAGEPTYPDDGTISMWLRRFDTYLGIGEQVVLFAILVIVVLTASAHAILEKATHEGLWWSFDVIRGGTFSIAMIGAAYTTHHQRHLAMDLISRKLSHRNRLVLAAILEVFTIAVCIMLARSGWHQVEAYGQETGRHLIDAHILVTFLPIGALLIAIHAGLHLLIHIDYLARGKTPPERMRSAH